ncbi:MAG: Gfo/Idh/MocA family oxidoreductase [Armatimonadetes bacterium]|nr:Gfo/Idh/MocA family oxidoreductase [Candidatus Hippobium faecium]
MEKVKAGIVGYGGLGHVHAGSLVIFDDVQVTCVCDIDPKKFEEKDSEINFEIKKEKLDISKVNTYEDFDEMLEKEEIDILVSALPTDLHADFAIKALDKGINVISEKPMSLTVADCQRMIDAKNRSGKELMIAQCVRFWPEYEYLEKCIDNGRYGKLWSVIMQRTGCYPYSSWFMDGERSGGAVLDLHVHDLDWVNYKFGPELDSMSAAGIVGTTGKVDDCNVLMKYGDVMVSIRGSWMEHASFSCYYKANFENATVEYRGEWGEVRVSDKDQATKEVIKIDKPNAYVLEMRYFIDTVKGLHKNEKCTPESTLQSIALANKEAEMIIG